MNRKEYLLVQAASECCEVAHRLTKALHFGLHEIQVRCTDTNAERVVDEFVQLLAVMEMLENEGHIRMPSEEEYKRLAEQKRDRVENYILHAQYLGTCEKSADPLADLATGSERLLRAREANEASEKS